MDLNEGRTVPTEDSNMKKKILSRDSRVNSRLEQIRIADLHFSFDNGAMIKLLKQRG